MTITAADVTLNVPELDGPLGMRIVVPGEDDARRRIGIVARVIAETYARPLREDRKCLWCGETPEGGMIWWMPGPLGTAISKAEPGPYCSSECWLSAS